TPRSFATLPSVAPSPAQDASAGPASGAPSPRRRRGLALTLPRRVRSQRRLLRARLTAERTLPIGMALIVIVASVVSLGPGAVRTVGAAQGSNPNVRLSVGRG